MTVCSVGSTWLLGGPVGQRLFLGKYDDVLLGLVVPMECDNVSDGAAEMEVEAGRMFLVFPRMVPYRLMNLYGYISL